MTWPHIGLFVDLNSDKESSRVGRGQGRGQGQKPGPGVGVGGGGEASRGFHLAAIHFDLLVLG